MCNICWPMTDENIYLTDFNYMMFWTRSKSFTEYSLNTRNVLSCSVMSNSSWPHELKPPESFAHGNLQARIPEWVAMPSSRGSSWLRDWTMSLTSPELQADSSPPETPGKPKYKKIYIFIKFILIYDVNKNRSGNLWVNKCRFEL